MSSVFPYSCFYALIEVFVNIFCTLRKLSVCFTFSKLIKILKSLRSDSELLFKVGEEGWVSKYCKVTEEGKPLLALKRTLVIWARWTEVVVLKAYVSVSYYPITGVTHMYAAPRGWGTARERAPPAPPWGKPASHWWTTRSVKWAATQGGKWEFGIWDWRRLPQRTPTSLQRFSELSEFRRALGFSLMAKDSVLVSVTAHPSSRRPFPR